MCGHKGELGGENQWITFVLIIRKFIKALSWRVTRGKTMLEANTVHTHNEGSVTTGVAWDLAVCKISSY